MRAPPSIDTELLMNIQSHALDTRGAGWRAAIVGAALAVALCGLAYPGLTASLGGLLFPEQARGSLIVRNGIVVGSALVAQPFAAEGYLIPRPSAAGFNPMAAAGSNWAPSNPTLRERMQAEAQAVATREGIAVEQVPVELISASGSGLDPHLSPAAAAVQVARIARARGLSEEAVRATIAAHTEAPLLGVFGEPRVNVLAVNLALDAATPAPQPQPQP
jgi:K+-transporting ATPase ATPase C chain